MTRQPPPGMNETIAAEVEGRAPTPFSPLCPRSCNHRPDVFTQSDCIAAGECGCDATPAPVSHVVPVPALWAECAYCKEAGEEECLHPVDELRWNGEQWCCKECGS